MVGAGDGALRGRRGGADSVLFLLFGAIERVVGDPQELVSRLPRGVVSDAKAGGDAEIATVRAGDRPIVERAPKPLGGRGGACGVRVRQKEGELLASQAARHVDGPNV